MASKDRSTRRGLLAGATALLAGRRMSPAQARPPGSVGDMRLLTFGDSVLDCAGYNAHRLDPGRLLVRNRTVRGGGSAVAIVTVGGNDLLRGLAGDSGAGLLAFEATYERFLRALPIRPVVLGTVYDPTFGDDGRNFLAVPAPIARANHRRINEIIGALAARNGRLADLHAHFLRGDASWFTCTIEPSLRGASEIRRGFLARI